jgi:hypothetical protein
MTYDVNWAGIDGGEVVRMAWVPMGEHDKKVLVDLYPGEYDQCTLWLVVETQDVLGIVPCAEDKTSPCDVLFEQFHELGFSPVVNLLAEDSYYEDFE